MKKILYILLIFTMSSCDKLLDVTPETSVTFSNFFDTEKDIESLLIQMENFLTTKLTDLNEHAFMGLKCDSANTSYTQYQELNYTKVTGSTISLNWKGHYDLIYLANVIIENIDKANLPTNRLNFYLGEAYFVRGLAYFDLSRRWGNAIITDNSTATHAYGNSSAMEVLDKAIEDATYAASILPNFEDLKYLNGTSVTSKQLGGKGAVYALLAHAYAWKGSVIELYELDGDAQDCYNKSISAASEIIGGHVGAYTLMDGESRCALTTQGASVNIPENIFEIDLNNLSSSYAVTQGLGNTFVSWPVDETKSQSSITTRSLIIKIATVQSMYTGSDVRKNAFFYNPDAYVSTAANKGFAYPYKWRKLIYDVAVWDPTFRMARTIDANYCYWRLSDIILLRAECYAKIGGHDSQAIADLNTVRSKNSADIYPATGESDLKLAIFREREKELIMEGQHRYYDVIRNGYSYITSEFKGNFKTLSIDDIKRGALYLPIYTTAFENNDLLRQNQFWMVYM